MNMTTLELGEDVDEGLAALRVHDAAPERAARIRARCVAALAAGRLRSEARRSRNLGWRDWLEPAFAFGLSALFLAEAVARSIAVYR